MQNKYCNSNKPSQDLDDLTLPMTKLCTLHTHTLEYTGW